MRWLVAAFVAFTVLLPMATWAQVTDSAYGVMFEAQCGVCHGTTSNVPNAVSREALRAFSPERVLKALTTGAMVVNASGLSEREKRGLSEYLTGRPFGNAADRLAAAMPNRCASGMPLRDPSAGPHWNGMSPDPTTSARFQPTAAAGLTVEQLPRLRRKWAFGFPDGGAVRAQPTVAGGRVFVGSDNGVVYALDAQTGCVHWSFDAGEAVVAAVSVGALTGSQDRYVAYFGDFRANVYAVDAETGEQLWTVSVDDHEMTKITGSPVLDPQGGRLYVSVASWEELQGMANMSYECCTSQGSVVALDAGTGRQIWKTYTIPERPRPIRKNSAGTQLYGPAGASIWVAPTLDYRRRVLYVGTSNGYINVPDAGSSDAVIAFDLDTGKRRWSTQLLANDLNCGGGGATAAELRINCPGYISSSFPGSGANDDVSGSPVLYTLPNGRQILIAGQESGRTTALDPDNNGAVLWVAQAGDTIGPNQGGGLGAAADGEFYYRAVGFPDKTGAMAALRPATGERIWYTPHAKPTSCSDPEAGWCSSALLGAVTVIPGAVFTGGRDGILRAYSTGDGEILWEYNTMQEYETVNGVRAKGGSIGGHGPAIVGGMLFMGSGYSIVTSVPGNVLLAFGVE